MHLRPPRAARFVAFGLFVLCAAPTNPWATPRSIEFPQKIASWKAKRATQDVESAAIEAIKAGDLEKARALIDTMLLDDLLRRAEEQAAENDPALALNLIDRALDLSPKHLAALLAKAETSLQLAQQGIREGGPSSLITGSMRDAFEHFVKASKQDPSATFGAVRAAHMLGATQDALEWARSGRQLLAGQPSGNPVLGKLSPLPERTLAEAFFRAYTNSKSRVTQAESELDPEQADERVDAQLVQAAEALFIESEDALGHLLGRTSNQPWVWSTLSDLYVWEQRFDLALQRLQQGIERLPGDPTLLKRLSNVAHQSVGREAAVQLFESLVAQSPEDTLSLYYLGLQRFEYGLELFAAADYRPQLFENAEAAFRRSRELFEGNTELCLAYELVARAARGWCAYYGPADLELATQHFLSMNELKDGGIDYNLGAKLRNGILGMAFIGDSYNQRGDNLNAALSFEHAHHADPKDGDWANNAGFFLRDAAVEVEYLGKRLAAAARGEIKDPEVLQNLRQRVGIDPANPPANEAALLQAASIERLTLSRDLIWRSWLAYEKAAAIHSENVRIVNDAGLVLVYYDHSKLDVAEQLLKRAAEMGAIQVPAMRAEIDAAELDESERAAKEIEFRDLTEAWGDAYQNLGVLEWVHRGHAEKALAYLQRSVEIGPDPRPDLSNNLIPIIRGESQMMPGNYFDLKQWGRPSVQD